MRIRTYSITIASALTLAASVPAYADDSSIGGYGGPGGAIQDRISPPGEKPSPAGQVSPSEGEISGGGEAALDGAAPTGHGAGPERTAGPAGAVTAPTRNGAGEPAGGAGTLPFTGFDVVLLVGVAVMLLTLGVALRSVTGSAESAKPTAR